MESICRLKDRLFTDDLFEVVKQLSTGFVLYSKNAKRCVNARLHVSYSGEEANTCFWYTEFITDKFATMPFDFNGFIDFLNGEKKGDYWQYGDTILITSSFREKFLKELRQCGEALDEFPR